MRTTGGGGGLRVGPDRRAGTEKRAGERLLPSRSNSTRKGTHHVVKRPDQAGRRGPARGPTHLHPTRDTTVNPTTTRSYVEVVRGVAQRSGRPATVRGPPHVTRYILLPRAPTHPPQPPSAQQRHEGEGRGFVLRSPKDGLSAGTWRRKVVMCPRRGNDPASGHPRAHQPPLGRGTSPPAWDGRLDAPGQRRRHLPSSAWTRRREVKQGKSGGSVGTTDQGKGKGRSVVRPMGTVAYRGKGQGKGKGRGEGRLGQGGRGRSKGGEKLMGTTAYGGKGSKGRAANGDRPVGAASCRRDHHTMASCQNPPPSGRRNPHQFAAIGNRIWAPPAPRKFLGPFVKGSKNMFPQMCLYPKSSHCNGQFKPPIILQLSMLPCVLRCCLLGCLCWFINAAAEYPRIFHN